MFTVIPLEAIGCFMLSDRHHSLQYTLTTVSIYTRYGYASPICQEDAFLATLPPSWLQNLSPAVFKVDPVKAFEEYLWQWTCEHYEGDVSLDMAPTIGKVEYTEEGETFYQLAVTGPRYVVCWNTTTMYPAYPKRLKKADSIDEGWWKEGCQLWKTMRVFQMVVNRLHPSLTEDKQWLVDYLEAYSGQQGVIIQHQAQKYHDLYAATGMLSWHDYRQSEDRVCDWEEKLMV